MGEFAQVRHRLGGPTTAAAFTIVELLVVMTVVSVLIALVMPVLAGVRRRAEQITCLNHMRQLLLATHLYVGDHDAYPQPYQDQDIPDDRQRATALWFNGLDPYLNQPRLTGTSPDDRHQAKFKQDPIWRKLAHRADNRTIKMSEGFGAGSDAVRFVRAGAVRQPTRTVVFVDGRADDLRPGDGVSDDFSATEGDVGLRHDDAANVGFADGHASVERQPIRITPTRGDRVWYRHGTDFIWELE